MKKQNLSAKKSVLRIVLAMFVCLLGMNDLMAQTAVLDHEGELTMFYGPDSFIAAYNAAVDEDVITLSEGNFHVCDLINKQITIHGAGAYPDAVAGSFATVFLDSFIFSSSGAIIEGINIIGTVSLLGNSNSQFVKCNILFVRPYQIHSQNVSFVNCYITSLWFQQNPSNWVILNNIHIVNSVIWYAMYFTGQDHIANNSIIRMVGDNAMDSFTAYNSILISGSPYMPSNTCNFYNCIGIKNGNEGQVFENSLNSTVVEYDNITDVFPAFVGEDIFNEPFILDEGIAAGFLGNNGTEVGIHGGYYPYSNRPGYMKVRHCTVGDRTTDDGHLSVDIEVMTEE